MSDLEAALLDRLTDAPLSSEEEGLLLAAILGDDELAGAIGGLPPTRPQPAAGDEAKETGRPAGAYLRSVTVAGFRGIGPPTRLDIEPGPGLTVVCGRNGSGKSSFAEALEVLLTGSVRRFDDRPAVWRDTWRCLHADEPKVSAELTLEGVKGTAVVTCTWEAGEKRIGGGRVIVRVPGEPEAGVERLGWGDALRLYRPFLSHAELEVLLARPSDLYDSLNALLGLDDIAVIARRLSDARKRSDVAVKTAKDELARLRIVVDACDDERATAAAGLLSKGKIDVDQLRSLATGGTARDQGALRVLGQLRALNPPRPADVEAACAALEEAAAALEAAGTSAAGQASATADLLAAAVSHFQIHGPGDCPVCGRSDALDAQWLTETTDRIRALQAAAYLHREATTAATGALHSAQLVIGPVPTVLSDAQTVGIDTSGLAEKWRAWAQAPTPTAIPSGLRALSVHMRATHPGLIESATSVSGAVATELQRREDRWAPVATAVSTWCQFQDAAVAAKAASGRTKSVEDWLKQANNDLRNARLRPYAEGTATVWAKLRQHSNVDLVGMELIGSATSRAVDFDVTVDGQPAAGLGVMSQGEVNALALSVFLPRATSDKSPLRFVVIDDPVQAMDPSKVDGMARVFAEVAQSRQVVVFTHDDRLPAAVRNLGITARIVQVSRQSESTVEVRPAGDPAEQYLREAGGLAAGEGVPVPVAARVVPGLCRNAIEEVSFEITRKRRLGRGDTANSVEDALAAATKQMPRLALAIFDDASRGGEVYEWLNQRCGRWAADTVRAANEGSHTETKIDPGALVGDTRRLVAALREKLP